jgi:hypothetical protein
LQNRFIDAARIYAADEGSARRIWNLNFRGLTDGELETVTNLFQECGGSWKPFLFIDPLHNLLGWSEEFGRDTWIRDGAVQISGTSDDPDGGQRATRVINTAQIEQNLHQTVAVPGGFWYTLSVFARSDSGTSVELFQRCGEGAIRKAFSIGSRWGRLELAGRVDASSSNIQFGFTLQAGASIYLYGAQVDCQPSASAYCATTLPRGVYPDARFGEEGLQIQHDGPDQHSLACSIIVPEVAE